MGTGGARAGIFDPDGKQIAVFATEWHTEFPRPGRAEQDPDEWWRCIVEAVRGVMAAGQATSESIVGIGLDSTAATVVAMDENDRHLRPALLWMDVRAAPEADSLAATGDQALKYSGFGPVSAEWGAPKSMWIAKNEPEVFEKAKVICDCTDWLVNKLTGEWSMSLNHAAGKYFYDGDSGGWPVGLYQKAGAEAVLDKFPKNLLPIGEVVGGLRPDRAAELGLKPGTPVAEGAIDAYAGAIGLGVVEPGKMALITGSSHVMIGQSKTPVHAAGIWGSFTDAVIKGEYTVESGQSSTGSVAAWFKNNLAPIARERAKAAGVDPYTVLDELASQVPVGSDGLILLDHFQGNRAPYSDARSRGVFWGLSLGHTEGHMFRAIMEGVCFGTQSIFDVMRANGYPPESVVVSGGPAKSKLWMQLHADVTNVPMTFTDVREGPVLGSAMMAAVGAGIFPDLPAAAQQMVHTVAVIEPNQTAHEAYEYSYHAYLRTYDAMRELMRDMTRHLEQA
ncbi:MULTISPECIES: FGGY-family carbohydrate kinase [unclassified Luteococcus]|uniref:FGGY-family carbohydrate kinase n=1 Tax=unclassified Luteococcus TaxID=2639923 RepID=UPI00313A7EEB